MAKISHIAVIGAGLMGHGIALALARAGQRVSITDPFPDVRGSVIQRIYDSLQLMDTDEAHIKQTLSLIDVCDTTAAAVGTAEVVFEAVPEKLDLKRAVFAQIEADAPTSCILASNTSVMPITSIMANLHLKGRALGTHWWNPPHLIPLVEVVRTKWTDQGAIDDMIALLTAIGKTPVCVEKDVPGFIGNRLQHALWREAISLVENGICSATAVDDVVKASFGRRMAVLGPLENADLVGTELTKDIHSQVLSDLETSGVPSPYLEQLITDGKLGMKSGEGFRKWKAGDIETTKAKIASHLRQLEGILSD